MRETETGIVAQVQKLVRDRAHLRTVIESLLAVNRAAPGQIKGPIIEALEKALKYTE